VKILKTSVKDVRMLEVSFASTALLSSIICSGVVYLVDISEVPDFNEMYELYDPCTVMFFYR
jgi:DIM1 family U5 snRNP protein